MLEICQTYKGVVEMRWNLERISGELCWSSNMVMKLDSDCQLINYAWDLSNLWSSGWNEMKLGTYIKWGMLSPNMVIKLVSDCQLINCAWDLSNLWRSGWNEIKLVTYIKWGILSPNMVMKLDSDCQLKNYAWELSNPNMVMKLDSDFQLINYAWDLSNIWRIGWNEMKLGTYIKWGMLSPNMVIWN